MNEKKEKPIRKTISLPPSMWKAIEDYQFENRIKRETEAVRQIIKQGLESSPKASKN